MINLRVWVGFGSLDACIRWSFCSLVVVKLSTVFGDWTLSRRFHVLICSSSFGFLFYVLYAVWLVSPWIVKLPITDGVRILEFGSSGSIVVVTVLSSCRMVFPAQFNGFGASTLLSYCRWKSFGQIRFSPLLPWIVLCMSCSWLLWCLEQYNECLCVLPQ